MCEQFAGVSIFHCNTLFTCYTNCMACPLNLQGQIQDFGKGESEHRGGSLKQGVWGHSAPEAIGCFLFIALKSCQNARFKAYSYLFKEIQGT